MRKFERRFFDSDEVFTFIGNGEIGGKAHGLYFIRNILEEKFPHQDYPNISITIPTLTVITTEHFDAFMEQNKLYDINFSDLSDDRIAHAFQKTELPPKLVGDLWALISKVHSPLAIRSSSLLEDAMFEPFAGIYETKMTPNNQFDTETRFSKLVEAIKFVYASTFFKAARGYLEATNHQIVDEKMAVIIQEVVGQRIGNYFYPTISGVGRSYNFYPIGHAKSEEGVVHLAFGLGKTIVDEGISWTYSPAYPRANPPYNSISDLLKQTQTHFWAVNMGKLPVYDPVRETEYLEKIEVSDVEEDRSFRFVASTYEAQSDRIYPGVSSNGPKLINFAPILHADQIPVNEILKEILAICEQALDSPVEIEFATTLDPKQALPAKIGFLQVRPMVVSTEKVEISDAELQNSDSLVASENVLGNGVCNEIKDVVFVKPDAFDISKSRNVAKEIEQLNRTLVKEQIPYLLVGFGRWGSTDPWLGIPVDWGQIAGAKVIVESTLPEVNVDLSQGAHFFQNISSFQVSYFSVHHNSKYKIDWKWLNAQQKIWEGEFVKHVNLPYALEVKVDGKTGRGIIKK